MLDSDSVTPYNLNVNYEWHTAFRISVPVYNCSLWIHVLKIKSLYLCEISRRAVLVPPGNPDYETARITLNGQPTNLPFFSRLSKRWVSINAFQNHFWAPLFSTPGHCRIFPCDEYCQPNGIHRLFDRTVPSWMHWNMNDSF